MLHPSLPAQPKHRPQRTILAFRHVTLVDATGSPAKPDMTVVITGDGITDIGRAIDARIPSGARVIDGRGKFVIPGRLQ
jgi:imidazolonepropionase-like amidohydrolase